MSALETTQDVPLSVSDDGTIRVTGTRVSLDSVVHVYQRGAAAEEIALRFPALRLADIHSCLAYYLNHQEAVSDYLNRQAQAAGKLREHISRVPRQQEGLAEMRERIKRRKHGRREDFNVFLARVPDIPPPKNDKL